MSKKIDRWIADKAIELIAGWGVDIGNLPQIDRAVDTAIYTAERVIERIGKREVEHEQN